MTTSELTGVDREDRRPWRRGRFAVLAGLFAAVAITIGAEQLRSTEGPPSPARTVQISVAPGPAYPAAVIHRIVARQERPR